MMLICSLLKYIYSHIISHYIPKVNIKISINAYRRGYHKRDGAVAKCIGHTISCTDIAVIRTGYRISRLFCDNPISYLSNALPHLPTDSAQGGYPSAISSRPSWLCSPGIAKRSSGRSLRCPKQRNRKASGRSRTGRSFSRSDSRSAPRNRAGSLAAQSSADR